MTFNNPIATRTTKRSNYIQLDLVKIKKLEDNRRNSMDKKMIDITREQSEKNRLSNVDVVSSLSLYITILTVLVNNLIKAILNL